MKNPQTFENHAQLVPGFHFVTLPLILLGLIAATVNLFTASAYNHYNAALLVVVFLILVLLSWYCRAFALKAQDRAIRAEEQLRHYLITGKPLPEGLRLSQIIALRFASNAEFVALAERAAAEKMAPKAIKQAIANWKADYNRV